MARITLSGPGLDGFHTYQADDHVRVLVPEADGRVRSPVPDGYGMLDWPEPFPVSRKYTVRRYDSVAEELDLDVVLHDGGVASSWLAGVRVGDQVVIAGPPGAKAFAHNYDHYVFAVDLTALPAAARWLDESPADVSATVVIDIDDAGDTSYPLAERDSVEVIWNVREAGRSALASTVEALPERPGRTLLFAAGEATDIVALRRLRSGSWDRLVTGYWKRGVQDLDD